MFVVFVLLIVTGFVFFFFDRKRKVTNVVPMDYERMKLESPIERRLYDTLKFRGEVIRTQVPCGKYRIDLTLPAYRLAIECDGKAYHSSPEQKAHDQRKNRYLKKHGWKVLRFTGKAINGNMKSVIARIEKAKE